MPHYQKTQKDIAIINEKAKALEDKLKRQNNQESNFKNRASDWLFKHGFLDEESMIKQKMIKESEEILRKMKKRQKKRELVKLMSKAIGSSKTGMRNILSKNNKQKVEGEMKVVEKDSYINLGNLNHFEEPKSKKMKRKEKNECTKVTSKESTSNKVDYSKEFLDLIQNFEREWIKKNSSRIKSERCGLTISVEQSLNENKPPVSSSKSKIGDSHSLNNLEKNGIIFEEEEINSILIEETYEIEESYDTEEKLVTCGTQTDLCGDDIKSKVNLKDASTSNIKVMLDKNTQLSTTSCFKEIQAKPDLLESSTSCHNIKQLTKGCQSYVSLETKGTQASEDLFEASTLNILGMVNKSVQSEPTESTYFTADQFTASKISSQEFNTNMNNVASICSISNNFELIKRKSHIDLGPFAERCPELIYFIESNIEDRKKSSEESILENVVSVSEEKFVISVDISDLFKNKFVDKSFEVCNVKKTSSGDDIENLKAQRKKDKQIKYKDVCTSTEFVKEASTNTLNCEIPKRVFCDEALGKQWINEIFRNAHENNNILLLDNEHNDDLDNGLREKRIGDTFRVNSIREISGVNRTSKHHCENDENIVGEFQKEYFIKNTSGKANTDTSRNCVMENTTERITEENIPKNQFLEFSSANKIIEDRLKQNSIEVNFDKDTTKHLRKTSKINPVEDLRKSKRIIPEKFCMEDGSRLNFEEKIFGDNRMEGNNNNDLLNVTLRKICSPSEKFLEEMLNSKKAEEQLKNKWRDDITNKLIEELSRNVENSLKGEWAEELTGYPETEEILTSIKKILIKKNSERNCKGDWLKNESKDKLMTNVSDDELTEEKSGEHWIQEKVDPRLIKEKIVNNCIQDQSRNQTDGEQNERKRVGTKKSRRKITNRFKYVDENSNLNDLHLEVRKDKSKIWNKNEKLNTKWVERENSKSILLDEKESKRSNRGKSKLHCVEKKNSKSHWTDDDKTKNKLMECGKNHKHLQNENQDTLIYNKKINAIPNNEAKSYVKWSDKKTTNAEWERKECSKIEYANREKSNTELNYKTRLNIDCLSKEKATTESINEENTKRKRSNRGFFSTEKSDKNKYKIGWADKEKSNIEKESKKFANTDWSDKKQLQSVDSSSDNSTATWLNKEKLNIECTNEENINTEWTNKEKLQANNETQKRQCIDDKSLYKTQWVDEKSRDQWLKETLKNEWIKEKLKDLTLKETKRKESIKQILNELGKKESYVSELPGEVQINENISPVPSRCFNEKIPLKMDLTVKRSYSSPVVQIDNAVSCKYIDEYYDFDMKVTESTPCVFQTQEENICTPHCCESFAEVLPQREYDIDEINARDLWRSNMLSLESFNSFNNLYGNIEEATKMELLKATNWILFFEKAKRNAL